MSLWIPVFTDFPGHPKTVLLRRALKLQTAEAYVLRLWLWCAEHYPNGRPNLDLLEEACSWKGRPGALISALRSAEFLDDSGCLPGWEGRAGAQLERINAKRRADRERKSQRGRTEVARNSDGSRSDVAAKSRGGRCEVATQTEKEKEKEKDITVPTELVPAVAGRPNRRGRISDEAHAIVEFLDGWMRRRKRLLGLPEEGLPATLDGPDCVLANKMAAAHGASRVRFAIGWAMQDTKYWHDQIGSMKTLHGCIGKLITQSDRDWATLKDQPELWDEVPP